MNTTFLKGFTYFQLLELRTKLQDAYTKVASGKRVESINMNGSQTGLQLTTLPQIKSELTRVNRAIQAHPDATADEKTSRSGVSRFTLDFSQTTVC